MSESQAIVAVWASAVIHAASELHRRMVPREGDEQGCGWVGGTGGFHESVAIDRPNDILTVIVACDG